MLLKLKEKALGEIRLAAESGNSQRIRAETARLTEIETLIDRQETLNRQVEVFSNTDARTSSSHPVAEKERTVSLLPTTSSRQTAKVRRSEFIKDCARKGIRLVPKKGTLYENSRQEVVGIAFATERKENAWFLGLPIRGLEHAVLICKPEEGPTFCVCLPSRFVQKYRSSLSKSKGQVVFNVRREDGRHSLLIPSAGRVPIDEYIDRPEHINSPPN